MTSILFGILFGFTVLLGLSMQAFAEIKIDPNMVLEISPSKVKFGENVSFMITVPQYTKMPLEEGSTTYHVDVYDSDNEPVDSTLWLAWEPFDYVMWTGHLAYNITKADTFTISVEKTINLSERTGEIVQVGHFTITNNPPPLKQITRGISSEDVLCNDDLQLVFRTDESKTPACLTPDTVERLVERGNWIRQ